MKKLVKRGEIYWLINDDEPNGSVQAKTRPCIIVQNNEANTFSMVTIVVVATTKIAEKRYPWDVIVTDSSCGLKNPSRIMCNQIFTISTDELGDKIGNLSNSIMNQVDEALKQSLGLI
jgi:mRNA interferase MazF